MKKVLIVVLAAMALVGALLFSAGCTETLKREADLAAASARKIEADRRLQAQVTDDYIRKQEIELSLYQEKARFDEDISRERMVKVMLEMQALQIALRETREIVEPIGFNARAAASNSYTTNLMLVGSMLSTLALTAAVAFLAVSFQKRLLSLKAELAPKTAKKKR